MTNRRRFTAEFKARVALEALRGDKTMAHKTPGKSSREGITLVQLADMFPNEDSARQPSCGRFIALPAFNSQRPTGWPPPTTMIFLPLFDLDHQRHGRITGGTAGEQTGATTADYQFFNQFDGRSGPGR